MPTCQQTNPFSFISCSEDLITSMWTSVQEDKASPEWLFKGRKVKSAPHLHLLYGEGGLNGNLHEVCHLACTFINCHAAMSPLSQHSLWQLHCFVLFCCCILSLPSHYFSFGWCICQSQYYHGLIWLVSSLGLAPSFLIRRAHLLICQATTSCCQLPVPYFLPNCPIFLIWCIHWLRGGHFFIFLTSACFIANLPVFIQPGPYWCPCRPCLIQSASLLYATWGQLYVHCLKLY